MSFSPQSHGDPSSQSGSTSQEGSITVLYFAAAQTETGLFSEEIELSSVIQTVPPNSESSHAKSPSTVTVESQTRDSRPEQRLLPEPDAHLHPHSRSISAHTQAHGPPMTPRLSYLARVLIDRHSHTKLADVLEISGWSVNEEMIPKDDDDEGEGFESVVLRPGDVVAVIPPVSGG